MEILCDETGKWPEVSPEALKNSHEHAQSFDRCEGLLKFPIIHSQREIEEIFLLEKLASSTSSEHKSA